MEKYIDADKLKSKVKELNITTKTYEEQVSFSTALLMVTELIDSLQQEQQEADFKIEERKWVHDAVDNIFPEDGDFMSEVDFRKILKDTARHFYELGQCNARKK